MYALEQVTQYKLEDIVKVTKDMQNQGQRFMLITCVDLKDDTFDLIYQFDKDLVLTAFRVTVGKGQVVPSISPVFISALLIENEIQDLFGIEFSDLAIDYNHKLMTIEDVSAPQRVSNMNVQYAEKKSNTNAGSGN